MVSEFGIAAPDGDAWDFPKWVTKNTAQHADALLDRLLRAPDPQREAARRNRLRQWLVQVPSGRIGNTWMCWVCYADRCFTSPRHPRFRACRDCLLHDRAMAAKFGLKMLLPLMDWPMQPPCRLGEEPQVRWVRRLLADAWTTVSVLDEWRMDGCILVGTIADAREVDLLTWRRIANPSPSRSKRCWDSFVQQHHADLSSLLAES